MEESLNINGNSYLLLSAVERDYLKKSTKPEPPPVPAYQRFPTKMEAKLHVKLSKLFNEQLDCLSEAEALAMPQVGTIDASNVLMLVGKTSRAKDVVRRYVSYDPDDHTRRISKVPELSFPKESYKDVQATKYGVYYLLPIMDFFDAQRENKDDAGSVKLHLRNEYPLKVSNEDFDMILAPRVDS